MAESVFDTLVQGMSRDERMTMLQKIQGNSGLDPDPIVEDQIDPAEINLQDEYNRFSLWNKLIIFLRKVFTGKDHLKLVEQMLIANLGKRIIAKSQNMVDVRGEYVLDGFARQIEKLRENLQRLAGPLSQVMGDSRRQFITFMFSMIATTTYELISQEIDPQAVAAHHPEFNERDIKRKLLRSFQDILESVHTDQRNQVYMNYRFLYHLLQLASFPYTQILQEFQAPGGKMIPASFSSLEGVLRRLDSQIHSTTETPSSDVLHLVFVFLEKERTDPDEQSERLVHQLKQASEAIAALRRFVREVPLRDIIAFCGRDIRYAPLELSGGEDWFSLFRDHISDIIDKQVDVFVFNRRRKEMVAQLLQLAGSAAFPEASPYSTVPLYASCQYHFTIAAMRFVVQQIFREKWLSPLKVLLIDGDFYKDVNREEYDEAFQKIEQLDDRIQDFLSGLPKTSKNRPAELQGFLGNVDKQARKLIDDGIDSLTTLGDVIDGILYGEVGGRFDTIANLGQINGRSNQRFRTQLGKVLEDITKVKEMLVEIVEQERTKRRL